MKLQVFILQANENFHYPIQCSVCNILHHTRNFFHCYKQFSLQKVVTIRFKIIQLKPLIWKGQHLRKSNIITLQRDGSMLNAISQRTCDNLPK